MSESIRAILHPQPDDMTFEQAIEHVRKCLFWHYTDEQWTDQLCTPLDRDYFDRLMEVVEKAHERSCDEYGNYEAGCAEGHYHGMKEIAKRIQEIMNDTRRTNAEKVCWLQSFLRGFLGDDV